MQLREFCFPLDPEADQPLYLQLAEIIQQRILDGNLKPGEALPSSRDLATQCAIARKTAVAALRELCLDGWTESRLGSGTYVCAVLPTEKPRLGRSDLATAENLGFDLPSFSASLSSGAPDSLDLRFEWPDARLLPAEFLSQAYRLALDYRAGALLGPLALQVNQPFCHILSQWLGERWGVWRSERQIMDTRGQEAAMDIAVKGLLPPRARIALLRRPQHALLTRLEHLGFQTWEVPAGSLGPDLHALEQAKCQMFMVPSGNPPGEGSWNREGMMRVLQLAKERRIPVLELEGTRELFDGPRPEAPLAAIDPFGVCMLAGGFDCTLAPGLKLGYLLGPTVPIQALLKLRSKLRLGGDPLLAAVIARMMQEGKLSRILRALRPAYASRRAEARRVLRSSLGKDFQVEDPRFGLCVFLRTPPAFEIPAWIRRCSEKGLKLAHPSAPGLPLEVPVGMLDSEVMAAAGEIMASVAVVVSP